jgi:TolB-like protein
MAENADNPLTFFQELKRRRVIRVIIVYAAAAFVILELASIIQEPFRLPDWTIRLVFLILLIGLIITIILSWIYDITPEGIEKTKPSHELSKDDKPTGSKSWKIASYMSFVVMLVMVCFLIYPKIFKADQLSDLRDEEGMIRVAVLPFNNLTGDSSLYYWQDGISELLINGLAQSDELLVYSSNMVQDVLTGTKQVYSALMSPEIARRTASKISASTHITGNYIGSGKDVSIVLNLVNTGNGELIWTTRVDGDLETNYRLVVDRLSDTVRNYLEIKALEDKVKTDLSNAFPNSADAYRYYINGLNFIVARNYETAIESLLKAYHIDSTFTFAAFYLAFAHSFGGNNLVEGQYRWVKRAYELKHNLPLAYQPWIELWYACLITEDVDDIRRYCNMMYEAAIHSRFLLFDLGVTYSGYIGDYDKSILAFEKLEALNRHWEDDWKFSSYYWEHATTLLIADRPEEVDRITKIWQKVNPESGGLLVVQGAKSIMLKDSAKIQHYQDELRDWVKENYIEVDANSEFAIGIMYCWAKDSVSAINYFRKAYDLNSKDLENVYFLLICQLRTNMNIEECLRLSEIGLEKQPESLRFKWAKGYTLHKIGRHKEALAILKEVDEMWLGYNRFLKNDIQTVERDLASQYQ